MYLKACVLLRLVVAWGSNWRREFNICKVINVRRSMDDQPQRAPRAQSGVVFLCVLCELCGFLIYYRGMHGVSL